MTKTQQHNKAPVVSKLACSLLLAGSLVATQSHAATEIYEDNRFYDAPDATSMVLDSYIAKPLHAAMLVGGFATWVVSLPFSVVSNSQEEAWQKLVLEPAASLRRCLGCTPVQDERKVMYDYYQEQERLRNAPPEKPYEFEEYP